MAKEKTTKTPKAPKGPKYQNLSLPSSSQFLGTETKKSLPEASFFRDLFDSYLQKPETIAMTPEVQDAINYGISNSKNLYDQSGSANPYVADGLRALEQTMNSAGLSVGREDDLLSALTNGALNGFSPEEMQVARERARGEITNALQGAIRGSLGNAGNLGVFGRDVTRSLIAPGSNGISALGGTQNALANMERDLFLQNIARKDQLAKDAFTMGDTMNKRKFSQLQDASTNLMEGGLRAQDQRMNAFKTMMDTASAAGNQQYNFQTANQDNLNAWATARLGAFTGGLGYGDSARNNKDIIEIQRKAVSKSGGSGGGGYRAPIQNNSAYTSREWNQPAGPTNQSSASGSQYR